MANAERVLFVHAHPDDETIDTGGTIAILVDRGAQVTVLTCTRGERGEVIPADLKYALESPTALATLRESELSAALKILGVTDHRFLGAPDARWSGNADRSYVDSGMRWGTQGAEADDVTDPSSLAAADLGDVCADIAAVIIATGPDAVISYDDRGGYGHPDHVRAHDAARAAADAYGVPFYSVIPGSVVGQTKADLEVDVSPVLERKRSALAAFRSQLRLDGDTIVFPGGQHQPVGTLERYALVAPAADGAIPFSEQHPLTRFGLSVLAGVIGVAVGGLLSVYNQSTVLIAGQNIWIGVIAAVAIVAALFVGLRLAFATRIVLAFAAVATIVIVGILSLLGAGGSVVIPWNGPGIVWQISPAIIAFIVLVWPQGRRSTPGKIASNTVSPRGLQQP